jgi:hypothetical protein
MSPASCFALSFAVNAKPEAVFEVDVMGRGIDALRETSDKLGLAFDGATLSWVPPPI